MRKLVVLIIFFFCSSFAFQQELSKDDGTFESSLATASDLGIGQVYSMSPNYSLLFAKVYLSNHTALLTIYVYSYGDQITLLGTATLSNPTSGWNMVNISGIQLPPVIPPEIILVARDSGSVGEDLSPPNNWHYRVEYSSPYDLFYVDPYNVGVRLIVNNSPPAVASTSVGNLKAIYR